MKESEIRRIKLNDLVNESQYSQRQIALRSGVSYTHLNAVLRGRMELTKDFYLRVKYQLEK